MELHFGTYREMDKKDQLEIKELIILGNEANVDLLENRLYTSALTAYFNDENKIIATTSIKAPEAIYTSSIFEKAISEFNSSSYTFELGYVFVDLPYRNQKLASTLCSELIQKFKNKDLFSTTRTDNYGMQSILNMLGFVPNGNTYPSIFKAKSLRLYTRNSFLNEKEKLHELVYDTHI